MNTMIMENLKERIENTNFTPIEFCYILINEIENLTFEAQVDWVQALCDIFGNVKLKNEDEANEHPSFTDEEIVEYVFNSGKYINSVIRILTFKGHEQQYTKEMFNYELWKAIKNGGLLTTKKELAGALVNVINSDLIPYYTINTGIVFSDSEFDERLKGSLEVFRKIRYIVSLDHVQKTQSISLILDEILNMNNREDQTMALLLACSIISEKDNDLITVLKKAINEDEE